MIAKIAVSAAIFAIDKPYSYACGEALALKPGMRVQVPFGRGNRLCEGIVLSLETGAEDGLKAVACALDAEPVLSDEMLRLAAMIRERYFCTFYDAVHAMLPAGLWFTPKDYLRIEEPDWRDVVKRNPGAVAVMESIEARGGGADYDALRGEFDDAALETALRYLTGKKVLSSQTSFFRRVNDKTERIAELAVCAEEAADYLARKRRSAPLQCAALELLMTVGACAAKELCYFTGASMASLNRLEKAGFLTYRYQTVPRTKRKLPPEPPRPIVLNAQQQAVFDGLRRQAGQEKPGVALLYGVTGSGKTAVYLKLIASCLAEGKSAILLVPEIALTPQFLALFSAHFGEKVAVLHSGLRVSERYDEYKRIQRGDAAVVIGTRLAVFAPVSRLGLLIVDEEQEHTYKSENSPRYHAREVAIYRGAKARCLTLLGSATPSIETMYYARSGVYQLYRLQNRFNGRALPAVEVVDMKREIKNGNGSPLSGELLEYMQENLRRGQQSILFLNRRGASRLTVCVDCGFVPHCPRCSVNLTYHSANHRLMCHYCGYSERLPETCPECGGHLKQVGYGTQRVELALRELLPEAKSLRMDADTISASNPHEKLLETFQKEKIPVLIGTQMVTKGLNFENVTLVGVLDADLALYVDSYRASETTFSMITQVVGRAGRGEKAGRAVIQTMTPQNTVLALAARQDYDAFYEAEISLRALRGCPPFADLLCVTFSGIFEERVIAASRRFAAQLAAAMRMPEYRALPLRVLGPAAASVTKVNNSFRYRLTVCGKNTRQLRLLLAQLLRDFAKDKQNKGVAAFADVNRYD